VRFGLSAWTAEYALQPAELARTAEQLGFESLFFPEHTHIPASRETPFIGGGDLPDYYADTYDPFVALMSAAAATSSLRIGTAICLVVERDPIVLARETATLDRLSGGRFVFGVGAGWNFEEMRGHGTDPKTRFRVLRERVEAIKAIWSARETSYQGEFVRFERIWQGVKPLQKPGPPVLVGLDGPKALDHVLAWGDEWLPTVRGERDVAAKLGLELPEVLRRRIAELRERADAAGRGRIPVTLAAGSPDARDLEAFAQAGIDRVLFGLEPRGRDEVLPRLEAVAELIGPYSGGGST